MGIWNIAFGKTLLSKGARYLSKQKNDIITFGQETVERSGVSENILECLTPFRRLSKKPCTLSDSNYFIKKFETEMGKDYIPTNWSTLSEAEKVDYIVRDRYSKLLSNKIMSKIQNESTENIFGLDVKGNITSYAKGSETHCTVFIPKDGTSIHNHPGFIKYKGYLDDEEISLLKKYRPEALPTVAHGGEDIRSVMASGERASYVVDSSGNKFLLEPKPGNPVDNKERFMQVLHAEQIMNQGDQASAIVADQVSARKDVIIENIFNKVKSYSALEGTPEYNPEQMLQYRLDFLETKVDYCPSTSWRTEVLPELGEMVGFRFKQI